MDERGHIVFGPRIDSECLGFENVIVVLAVPIPPLEVVTSMVEQIVVLDDSPPSIIAGVQCTLDLPLAHLHISRSSFRKIVGFKRLGKLLVRLVAIIFCPDTNFY